MTFSRSATVPTGFTAYLATPTDGANQVLRVSIAQGTLADLSAEDALALASYITDNFGTVQETSE